MGCRRARRPDTGGADVTVFPSRRIDVEELGDLDARPGDYGLVTEQGWWYVVPPRPGFHRAFITKHEVVAHEDGTITVTPSISTVYGNGRRWHGFLRSGVWVELDSSHALGG
jgi:hypothetical protein